MLGNAIARRRTPSVALRLLPTSGAAAEGLSEDQTPWGTEMYGPKEHSDATAHEIDEEIQRIINAEYAEARTLLQRNRESLQRVAEALLEREVMSAEEVMDAVQSALA